MLAKAGIQDFKYLNKIKIWILAFAGMTALFSNCDTASHSAAEPQHKKTFNS
jgi:hypothetical protein